MRNRRYWLESSQIASGIVWNQWHFGGYQRKMHRFGNQKCSEEQHRSFKVILCLCWYERLLSFDRSQLGNHLESALFDRTLAQKTAKTGPIVRKPLCPGRRQRRPLIRQLPYRPSYPPKEPRQRPYLPHIIRRRGRLSPFDRATRPTRPIQPT